MPKLSEDQKIFIVERLAMYDTPTQVAEAVKEEYGFEIDRQAVNFYNPTVGPKPAKRWVKLFEEVRERFKKSSAEIPIAQRSFRLRRLNQMALQAEKRGNYKLARELYEQAAKEVGDVFTNRQKVEHTDPDGNPFVAGVNVYVNNEKVQATAAQPKQSAQPSAA
jgi:hypothetical protein